MLARDAKRLAHYVHLVIPTMPFAEGHVVSRSQPPLAVRRHEISKILGVIVAIVKHHVKHDPLESNCLLPHVIAAELGGPQETGVIQRTGCTEVRAGKSSEDLHGDTHNLLPDLYCQQSACCSIYHSSRCPNGVIGIACRC